MKKIRLCVKRFTPLVFLLLYTHIAWGQSFQDSGTYISAGYGFGNINMMMILEEENARGLGPFYLKWEAGVTDHIGMGLNLSYFHVMGDVPVYSDSADTANGGSYIPIIGYKDGAILWVYGVMWRFNYHFANSKRVDPYVGLGIGYRGGRWNKGYSQWRGEGPVFHFGLAPSIGTRFYVSDSWGGYVEFGTEKALAQFGLTYRIGQ